MILENQVTFEYAIHKKLEKLAGSTLAFCVSSKVQMITLFQTIKISSLTRDLSKAVLLSSSVMIGILTVGLTVGVDDVTFDCFFRIVQSSSNAFKFRRNEGVDGR